MNTVVMPALGWNVLADYTRWTAAGYDLTAAMKKVHIDFWQDSLFTVKVGYDWIDPNQHVVEVSSFNAISFCSRHNVL